MLRLSNIKMNIEHDEKDILKKIKKLLNTDKISFYKISKKSIDARDKKNIFFVYSVDVKVNNEKKYLGRKNISEIKEYKYSVVAKKSEKRPIVVGSGPSGLFCALILSESGLNPIILERGKKVEERVKDINQFFEKAELSEESNVQFGEGGAGTFSDGKLTTGIKDIRIRKVIDEFIKSGAPEEIGYIARPHIGTDNLIKILKNIREKIISLGGEYKFSTKFTGIIKENNKLVGVKAESEGKEIIFDTDFAAICIGHSARDTYKVLRDENFNMALKPFSVGVRIEHSQKEINKSQYGEFYNKLGAADYKLSYKTKNQKGVYTFCMCPGGKVIASTSLKNHVITNGMSNFKRNEKNANSALLVGVSPKDFSENHIFSGINFQEELEKKAFLMGDSSYKAPVQLVGDFLNNRESKALGNIEPSYKPGYVLSDLRFLFSEELVEALKEGIINMDKKLSGFNSYDAVLTGVETRSSAPLTILRDENMESNIKGVFMAGEGAGYAGGIMSAAVDGIKCAENIIKQIG